MRELTKAEEQIMQILWLLGKAFVKEIIEEMPDPKPAYNTVSTIVRILERKGFVSHQAFGRSHQYFASVSEEEYKTSYFKNYLNSYFGNSFSSMISFFAKKEEMDVESFDKLMNEVREDLQSED
ncbi:BlaI/MecI/CopY family transcriptional regulator [Prolixibacteraceae bacterium JC049]|nr:BlaI/MecI/CopY family transcriptional regulator [Prolixibacteraceae bacterium JC049]